MCAVPNIHLTKKGTETHLHDPECVFRSPEEVFPEIIRTERARRAEHRRIEVEDSAAGGCGGHYGVQRDTDVKMTVG